LREDHVLQALTCLGCFPSNSHRIVILPVPACRGSGVTVSFCPSPNKSHYSPLCHPACPSVPWNRSEVERLFLFCPSDLTTPNKSHYSPLCHPACPGVPWNRSKVERLFLFCPSDLTTPNKSHYSPLCHPERSRGICGAPRLPHKGLRSVSSSTESSS
jgi:hypothetical protein